MYVRLMCNDLRRNKLVSFVILLFVIVSMLLISLASVMFTTLSGSTKTLMNQARTSHFLQMHSGTVNKQSLEKFAENNKDVSDYQLSEFLNLENAKMNFGKGSLIESVEDNGVSVQNEKFDFLLDLDGNKIEVKPGEIYAPVSYLKSNSISLGDTAELYGQKLKVVGFLRDSQMNSSLASSKRFLVSQIDYDKLKPFGKVESLIEYRLIDPKNLSRFESAYMDADLPTNGPTVTYPLFKLMNSLTDGLAIALILFISLLVIIVGLLCIRFSLLAQLEEDMKEIGVMKAIGISIKEIKKIYLYKYSLLIVSGSSIGFILSLLVKKPLVSNIKLFMGEGEHAFGGVWLSLVNICLVSFFIFAYISLILNRLKKVSTVDMLNQPVATKLSKMTNRLSLSESLLSVNSLLGVKDLITRSKMYITMLIVLIVATFIFIVPVKLYQTIASKDFSTYLGIGDYDFRMDIQQTDNIQEKITQLMTSLENDEIVEQVSLTKTSSFNVVVDENQVGKLRIENGDHSIYPIHYVEGSYPKNEKEIALSAMNAEDLGKGVGDSLILEIDSNQLDLTVSGIYSDLTNGGKTAKATMLDNSNDVMWYTINGTLRKKENVPVFIKNYQEQNKFAKISDIENFISYVYGTTIKNILYLSYLGIAIAILLSSLMMSLFIRMLIEKDKSEIAILKALGFTYQDIRKQYLSRFLALSIIGIFIGILLSNTLGQKIASLFISNFGVSSFIFSARGWLISLICVVTLILTIVLTTIINIKPIKKIEITKNLKE